MNDFGLSSDENDYDFEDHDYDNEYFLQIEEELFTILWDMKKEMINYTKDQCIPLLEYFNIDLWEQYILTKQNSNE